MANFRLLNRNGTWYYFRKVPVALVPKFGKLIKISLKTKEKSEAKKLRAIKDLEYDALFAQCGEGQLSAQGPTEITLDQMLDYVRGYVARDDTRSAKEWENDPPTTDEQLDDLLSEAEKRIDVLTGPADEERDLLIRSCSKAIASDQGLGEVTLSPAASDLVRRALIELYLRRLDRLHAKHEKQWHDHLFAPEAPPSVTFGKHADAYLAEKEGEWAVAKTGESWKKKVRACVSTLIAMVGPETPLKNIDDAFAKGIRVKLGRVPSNRVKLYPHVSIDEAIILGESQKKPKLDATTQTDYLSHFANILDLAQRRGLINFNPAKGLKPLTKPLPAEQRRKPFRDEQLVQFFTGTFYQSCAPGAEQPYVKDNRDWRFWIPLLMAFNGGRPNELAQLLVRDVRRTKKGTWYVDLIGDDHEDGDVAINVKNESSRRRIPLHLTIKQIGFLAFVEQRKTVSGIDARLFPTLGPNKLGNFAHRVSKNFNQHWLEQDLQLEKRQTLYSFRHSCRDALRRAGAPSEALGVIAGWSEGQKPVSSNYGDPNNPDHYQSWVDAICYDGLNCSAMVVNSPWA